MARTVDVLRVFVASPGDVAEERTLLESVVRELNNTWSNTLSVYLELVKWETHAFPGVGGDSQDVINKEIEDDYDIFIGIIWSRFGTATPRAESGTWEEYERAHARYLRDPHNIRIMFYFKDQPIAPSQLDPAQLSKIQSCKTQLGEQGTLYWCFGSAEDFVQYVRMHLSRQVQGWRKTWGLATSGLSKEAPSTVAILAEKQIVNSVMPNSEAEEDGYLDLIDEGTDSFETNVEVTARITSAMNDFTARIAQRTSEIQALQADSETPSVKQAKRYTNKAAEDMDSFAAVLEVEISTLKESFSRGITSFTKAFAMVPGQGGVNVETLHSSLSSTQQFKETLEGVRTQNRAFRDSIASLPRMTSLVNKARRRLTSALESLDAVLEGAINLLSENAKQLQTMISSQP